MHKAIFLFFMALSSIVAEAQLNCATELSCKVTASSGMRMRSEPSLRSSVVISVPHDSLVTACKETFGSMSYEKINGYWRKVYYRGKQGFMFDGFLEIVSIIEPPVIKLNNDSTLEGKTPGETKKAAPKEIKYSLLTEAYNYCGDVKSIDAGLLWYGVYPEGGVDGESVFRIKEVTVDILLSKQKVGKGLEFDIQTDKEEKSIFLIGLNQPLPLGSDILPDNSEQLRSMNRKLFPGQELKLTYGSEAVKLSATGSVISTGACPELKDYKLVLSGEKLFLPVQQDIVKEIGGAGKCGMPEIFWYGDLNGDAIPEIIFVTVYDEKNQFTLFLSDPVMDSKILRKEAEWTIDKCY